MVVPFLATAAWLGLGALGVLGAKEKETKRLRGNATLREQRQSAENALTRRYVAAQNSYSRYLRRDATAFADLDQERWEALANMNREFNENKKDSTVFYDFAMPILKGTTLALELFGGTVVNRRKTQV